MKFKKYAISLIILGMSIIPSLTYGKDIEIYVNNNLVFMDVAPIVEEGITFVPVGFVAKSLGGIVSWESPKVIVQTSGGWIECQVGSKVATKGGKEIELVAAPQLINGRVYVPLRFISEVLGQKAEYKADEKRIDITKLKNYRVEGFHDPQSNKCLCNVWSESGSEKIAILVHDEKTNTWSKFDPKFEPLWVGQKSRPQRATHADLSSPRYSEDYGSIDLEHNKWIHDFDYSLSRNEKYGVMTRLQYREVEGVPEKYEGIFLKNFETGEVREVYRSYIGVSASWVNELSLKVPVEGETYDSVIYNVVTGAYNYLTYEEVEKANLILQADRDTWTKPHVIPEDLNIGDLPTITLEESQKMEARLTMAGKNFDIPFAFEKEADSYVPLKYIIQGVGGVVEQDKRYVFNGYILELTDERSARYNQQFFVSKQALQEMGIEFELEYLR